MCLTRRLIVMLTALVLETSACFAQASPSDAELDALLAAKDWNKLGAALSRPDRDQAKSLDWMKAKLESGGWYMVSVLYARDLWAIGELQHSDDPNKDMRVLSGVIALYTLAMISVDGTKCEDQTAPGHRMDQLIEARGNSLRFLKQQPAAIKAKAIELAMALEARTSTARQSDDLVCRGGMAEMQAGLEHGTQHPMPNAPGTVGKSIGVAPPPGWHPALLPEAVYLPKQASARAALKAGLEKLLD